MVYIEEKIRLRYCDGKDKYFHPTGTKDVEKYIFDKTACQTPNSVSRMINWTNCSKWNVCDKFSFHIDTTRYLEKLSENDPNTVYYSNNCFLQ